MNIKMIYIYWIKSNYNKNIKITFEEYDSFRRNVHSLIFKSLFDCAFL